MSFMRSRPLLRRVHAAPWPYVTSSLALAASLALKGAGMAHWVDGDLARAAVCGGWGAGWLVVALFALADAVSRYREYRRIRAMFLRFGYSDRILEPLARSRCQRDAAVFAAEETGHGHRARAYFASLGYRWYHILPDLVVRNPLTFLSPRFLRSSFLPGKKARS